MSKTKADLQKEMSILSANLTYYIQRFERLHKHFEKFEERTNKRLHKIEGRGIDE